MLQKFESGNLTPMNPTIPRVYDLLKLHKDGLPIPRIASFVNSHKLAKWFFIKF